MVNNSLDVDFLGVDELLNHTQIYFGMVLGEDIVKAALWNTHVKWHLAAFKSVD